MEALSNKHVEVYNSSNVKVAEQVTDVMGSCSFTLPIGTYKIKVIKESNQSVNNDGSTIVDANNGNNVLLSDGASGIDLSTTSGATVNLLFDQTS